MITRDASPYPAFSLENFRFSFKARYVNDVHLPRFDRGLSRRPRQYGVIRNCHPQSIGHHGDSKDFSPSNAWNDSKTAVLRQLPRPAAAVPVITRGQRQCRYTEWVYQQCQEGRVIAPMGLRQCKLALARTQGCTLHCARLRSPKCKFALQRMQT